jgi:hypothetical protein
MRCTASTARQKSGQDCQMSAPFCDARHIAQPERPRRYASMEGNSIRAQLPLGIVDEQREIRARVARTECVAVPPARSHVAARSGNAGRARRAGAKPGRADRAVRLP